jgi:Fe-S-cluster-containing dehydrogenase component
MIIKPTNNKIYIIFNKMLTKITMLSQQKNQKKYEKVLIFDPELCTGCSICEIICSLTKYKECNPSKSLIKIVKNEEMDINMAILNIECNLCMGEEKCVKYCPTNALEFINKNDAILLRKKNKMGKHPVPYSPKKWRI